MTFKPRDKDIVQILLSQDITPSAKEGAADLVDAWVREFSDEDLKYKTVAVEVPWFYWIQPRTVIIGVMDRLAKDVRGIFGSEWKSTKEPQVNTDGRDSAWWNEEVWLKSISEGSQLSIYGLALYRGTFIPSGTAGPGWTPNVQNPRIMVRAAVKSNPVRFWPSDPKDGIFQFPNDYLDKVVVPSLIAKASGIRAMRASKSIPWALPGNHCVNRFRKTCPYHEKYCLPHKHPKGARKEIFDMSDPGSRALSVSGALKYRDDADLVIFSASSFDTAQQCPERYRILVGGYAAKERDQNLDVGTGLHAGVAGLYMQHMNYHAKLDKGKRK